MTDQMRWDALGFEQPWMHTPHLDRLEREGVRFTTCYTNSPQCQPARLSLATGLYPHTTGVWRNCAHSLEPSCPNWMQIIRRAGYRTSLFGKTHLHRQGRDLRRYEHLLHAYGLDDVDEIGGPRASSRKAHYSHMTQLWRDSGFFEAVHSDYHYRSENEPWLVRPSILPFELYFDVYVGQQARLYLETYDRKAPWFCWVSFGGPHEPWDTPEPWASYYNRNAMPPALRIPVWVRDCTESVLLAKEQPRLSKEQIAALKADYAGNVSLIDEQIGQILEVIEARGEMDNTIIVFTSDHGEHNGDFGRIYKSTFFECAARIPLIVRVPNSKNAGQSVDTPCELMDVGATLVDLVGEDFPYKQFAVSLAPCLDDLTNRPRDVAICEVGNELMVTDGTWKLWFAGSGNPYALTNRRTDPEEQRNFLTEMEQCSTIESLQCAMCTALYTGQLREPRVITLIENVDRR